MKKYNLAILVILLVIGVSALLISLKCETENVKESNQIESNEVFLNQVEIEIINMINQERLENKKTILLFNEKCKEYALAKSRDMATKKYFSPEDQQGNFVYQYMKRDNFKFESLGENIAFVISQNDTPESLAAKFIDNWINDCDYQKNILNPDFTQVGVGVYKTGNIYFATQIFIK